MLKLILTLVISLPAFAQNVVDSWPKGLVNSTTSHVKVLFDKDVVPFESIGGPVKAGLIKLAKGKLKDCRWDTRRLAHCKMERPLSPNSNDAILVDKYRQEFRTMGLHLLDYSESIQDEKFRLKLKFSAPINPNKVKIAISCGSLAPKAFIGNISSDGVYRLPVKVNPSELCRFSFPEGIKDLVGIKHSLTGEWMLRGRLGLPENEKRYKLAIRSVGCDPTHHWNMIDTWKVGGTMPVITCALGAKISVNLNEDWQKNIKLSVSNGGPLLTTEKWGGSVGKIPTESAGSFTVVATHQVDPQLSAGYIVLVRSAEELLPGYAELDDDGSYFEHKPPYLIKLNHRGIPLVEVSAKKLTDPKDIMAAVNKGESYWERRSVKYDMPKGETFQLEAQGSTDYNSGLELARLDDFAPGIWWVQSKVAAPPLSSPLAIPEGDEKKLASAAVLQFSDLGIHIKRGLKGGLVWVFRISTGKPVAGAQVVISHKNQILDLGETKKDGTLSITTDKQIDPAGVVIASIDKEMVALPLNYRMQSGISHWDFGHTLISEEELDWTYDAIPSNPLYRPGDKVELKLFARKTGLEGPEIDDLRGVKWNITDPRGEKITSGEVSFNEFGTAVISAQLDKEATTGKYILSIGRQSLEPFSVEMYRPPTLKVAVDSFKLTKPLRIAGDVEFFVGGGVQDTTGEVALILKTKSYTPPSNSSYETFSFTQSGDGQASLIGKESFTTDKTGRFNARFNAIELPDFGTLIAEATVTDGDGSTVSGRTDLTVARRGWFLGTKLDGYVFNDGQEVKPQLIVLDKDGAPQAGLKLRLTLERRTWNTVRRLGSGNTYYYDSEERKENLGSCEVISSLTVATCPLKIKGEGSYTISASASLNGETETGQTMHFWVPGPNSWGWGGRNNHDRIEVRPEKASYEFGEKAKFLIQSPYKEGEALVTIERYGVIRHEVVKFKGGFWTYQLSLEDSAYVPGVFLSVVMLKGRTSEPFEGGVDLGRPSFKMGYAQIQVKRTPMVLNVGVKTEARYSPGDEVKVELSVNDWKGKKVTGELAVTVVDDAVLHLVPEYKAFFEVMDTFYHIKGIGIWNYQTLTRLIGRRSFGKKGAAAGGDGGLGADVLRSNFKTVAHWEPTLAIKNGKANFSFKLPDNLTSWRVVAVAVDEKHRFGEGETTFKSIRPLMLTSFFPPFLRMGDKFVGTFGIQNATEDKLEATLTAKLENLDPVDVTATQMVTPGARELVHFPFKTTNTQEINLEARVKADSFKDGIKLQFPVLPETNNLAVNGYLTPLTGTQTLSYSLPKQALPGSAQLKVVFSKSLLDGLDDAFKYVVGYPYGCWEQKTTGALFLTQYKQMQPWLNEFKFDESKGDARQAIQDYIDSAPEYQRADGSMGYYPGDYAGDPYLTIFTGHAFGVYKKAGFKISEKVNNLLMERLKAMKDHSQDMGRFTKFVPSMKAYIARILVDLGDQEGLKLASKLYSERAKMDLFGKGMLLMSLPKGSKEAQTLMDELLKNTIATGSSINFKEVVTDDAQNWLYSLKRSECVVVEALLRQGVNNALAAKLVYGLAPGRNATRWYNTQENFFCFQAYQTFAALFESTDKEAVISWSFAGNEKELKVKPLENSKLQYDERELLSKTAAKAKLVSGGNAYIRSIVRYQVKSADMIAAGNGFALEKTVLLKTNKGWQPLTGPVWKMKKGDIVKIILNVRAVGEERFKVGLTDPLPAAWRAINPRLATSSVATQVEAGVEEAEEKPEYDWWDWHTPQGFIGTDMRESSVQYFADSLKQGESYPLEYLAQVTTVGEFTLPATVIEEMYNEENRANTTGVKIHVAE